MADQGARDVGSARGAPAAPTPGVANEAKAPRTARGALTMRKLLDAAMEEFGEKGFGDGSIVGITRRAGVALGTFYTYFDSKEEVFQALVRDMSEQVRLAVAPALAGAGDPLDRERGALAALLRLIQSRQQVYRIIDEAEFVDPAGYREHYVGAAARIAARLRAAAADGAIRRQDSAFAEEVVAWAVMGANVFVGLRYGVWESEDPDQVANIVNRLLRDGLKP
ncbi:TetR/AcrR family transcriptional regulator [Sphingomonas sp.]|uniref:TetR/AcrR family transcriptional regulator n=1 Tax=Sphingomonas sp. TaxID=28214 RepID=UPI00286DEEF0|nr:TetR/AcrR family transcriptional regulator [Sphingomonas sp.]